MIHISNGDIAIQKIKEAELQTGGEFIPWRDVLHEGPVPDIPAEQLAKVRAAYIAKRGWGDGNAAYNFFLQRNSKLLAGHDKIFLWFEPDLYDQLQLLQALALLSGVNTSGTKIFLMQALNYFEDMSREEIAHVYFHRKELPAYTIALAGRLWKAFSASDPAPLREELEHEDFSTLPYLQDALGRLMEEFPSGEDGLGRTERQILKILSAGERLLRDIFVLNNRMEQWKYITDSAFADYIERLAEADYPLICSSTGGSVRLWRMFPNKADFWRQSLILTKAGKEVLAGEKNFVSINGIDRWIGGVHLSGEAAGS